MKRLFTDYGLSITLFVLAVAAMVLQWHFTWDTLVAEAAEQGQEVPAFYLIWSTYWANVWENLQSEWWQLFTFVVLTSFLIHKGSHESKDSDEKTERKIDAIRCEVANVESELVRLREDLQNHRNFINRVLTKNGYPHDEP
jgi:hypothetical protein